MTNTKVTLPEGLVTQRPKVKNGDEVLVLAGTFGKEGNYVGKIRVVERSDVDNDGDIALEYTKGADGRYANSWAVVNGPVQKGDKVIALKDVPEDRSCVLAGSIQTVVVVGPGEHLTYAGEILVNPSGKPGGGWYLKRWAKLEGENAQLLADGEEVAPVVHYRTGEEIKVGDRVKAQFCGLSDGTVTGLAEPAYVYVKLDGRSILPHRAGAGCFPSRGLTFVARKEPELLPVGTRVKVTGAVHAAHTHGKTGVIDRHSDKVFTHDVLGRVLHPYHVTLDNAWGVYAHSVEVIEDAKTDGPASEPASDSLPHGSFTAEQLKDILSDVPGALEALGLAPAPADVLIDVMVSVVKDDDGDIWIQSLELFGDLEFRLVVSDETMVTDADPGDIAPRSFAELADDHGVNKVEL